MQSKSTQLNSDPDNEKERSLRKISSSIKFTFHINSSLILLCTNLLIKEVVTSEIANERTPYRLQHSKNVSANRWLHQAKVNTMASDSLNNSTFTRQALMELAVRRCNSSRIEIVLARTGNRSQCVVYGRPHTRLNPFIQAIQKSWTLGLPRSHNKCVYN